METKSIIYSLTDLECGYYVVENHPILGKCTDVNGILVENRFLPYHVRGGLTIKFHNSADDIDKFKLYHSEVEHRFDQEQQPYSKSCTFPKNSGKVFHWPY